MKSLRVMPFLLAVAVLACNSPTGTEPRQLHVIADANTVTIENPNDWPVFYLLANPNFLAVADLLMCNNPDLPCPRVPPRGTVRVPYADIVGYEAGEKEATLWQWRLVRQADGTYQSTNFRTTTLGLR